MGLRPSLDILEKTKISCPYQDPNPGLSNLYLSHYTNCITLALTAKTIEH